MLKTTQIRHDPKTAQYNKRSILRALVASIKERKGQYTIASVGIPPASNPLREHWKPALRQALRISKKRHLLEYVLLLETSPLGYEHAHLLLMAISPYHRKLKISKIPAWLLAEIRFQFFLCLYKRVFKIGRKKGQKIDAVNTPQLADKLGLNQKQAFRHISKYIQNGQKKVAGQAPGMVGYMLAKPELVNGGSTISAGLLKLRIPKVPKKRQAVAAH